MNLAVLHPLTIALARPATHVFGASGLVVVVLFTLFSLAVLGDPSKAEARVVRPLPDLKSASLDLTLALRQPDDAAPGHLHEPILDLRPHSDSESEPRLTGVGDLTAHDDHHGGHDDHHAEPDGSESEHAPARADGLALAEAPLAGFYESGPRGPLPIINADGRRPLEAYARPFERAGDQPIIAIVVGGLGLSEEATARAIAALPPEVTLGFVPYTDDLQSWIDRARAAGHEVVLEAPMEPYDYPENDPGPYTLLAEVDAAENQRRLEWLMSQGAGYFGVMNYLGARFIASERAVGGMLDILGARGVALIHDGESKRAALDGAAARRGVAFAAADRVLDTDLAKSAIDEQLLELEALAIQNGASLGVGAAYPVTIEHVAAWTETLALKGYVLAPASAVVRARAADPGAHAAVAHADHDAAPPPTVFKKVTASYGRPKGDSAEGKKADYDGGH
ncbi:MAG: divergent polysaccharide deacetylase family protein [Caulobacterales bacterium]|nr:divergent polysaccharide deacetylase family protein [Caulobacterales bacterium]